jgi:hypothetical protein
MQFQLSVPLNESRSTGIGPGLWLITCRISVTAEAPAGDALSASAALEGFYPVRVDVFPTSTALNVPLTIAPETLATQNYLFFASLVQVVAPDLRATCSGSEGLTGGASFDICAERIG